MTKNIFSVSFVTRMPGSTESSISSLGDCEVKYHINVFFNSSLIRILEIEGLYDQNLISGWPSWRGGCDCFEKKSCRTGNCSCSKPSRGARGEPLNNMEFINEWMNHNGNTGPEGVWYQFRVWQVWNFKTNQRETLIDGDYWRRVRNCNDGDCPEKIMISQCAKAGTQHVRHFLSELYASTLGCAKVILCTTVLVQ